MDVLYGVNDRRGVQVEAHRSIVPAFALGAQIPAYFIGCRRIMSTCLLALANLCYDFDVGAPTIWLERFYCYSHLHRLERHWLIQLHGLFVSQLSRHYVCSLHSWFFRSR